MERSLRSKLAEAPAQAMPALWIKVLGNAFVWIRSLKQALATDFVRALHKACAKAFVWGISREYRIKEDILYTRWPVIHGCVFLR